MADEDELYDEFGNYIGPELGESDDDEPEEFEDAGPTFDDAMQVTVHDTVHAEQRIVLHEDKKYYLDADEVYPGVKAVTLEEDAQKLTEPIIKPIKVKNFGSVVSGKDSTLPKMKYSLDFMATLMNTPTLIRSIALIGQLHSGKTLFLDTLVQAAKEEEDDPSKTLKFTDTRLDEQNRQMSVKSSFVSLILEDLKSKSYLINLIDCPGHVNFSDETTAALRLVDGAVIVVDAVEGVMMNTERLIRHALDAQVQLHLVINKIDRLVLELKLPPQDAYFKISHTIDEVNKIIASHGGSNNRLSPERGNVTFSSGLHGWSFTLHSFAESYNAKYHGAIDSVEFAKRLWGDWYHNEVTNAFTKKKPNSSAVRTFVAFVLEPLYKLYSQIIGEEPEAIQRSMKRIGVILRNKEIHLDPQPLLKLCLSRYFANPKGFVDSIIRTIPSPIDGAETKIKAHYSGYQTSEIAASMRTCRSSANLMANVTKLYNSTDGTKFWALARIYSGTIDKGQKIRVLGEGYSADDEEDMAVTEVTSISIGIGRHFVEVNSAIAGNCVLLEGIDASIKKTATIIDTELEDAAIFKPLTFNNTSVVKVAVEPLNPAELPKMVESLRRVCKSYPLVTSKVEESGEHVIIGTGEIYMDCVLHDLRHLYTDIEIKLADPVSTFCETVIETSAMKCYSETTNKKNRLAMIAEPMEKGLSEDIEAGNISLSWNKKSVSDFFMGKYDWDLLAARSIWTFGPEENGPNILMDDTLPSEVNKGLLNTVRESVVQGFKWGCREGPLCDEPIRNSKFKILDAAVSSEAIYRGGGQVIPASRRAVYSSFLLAQPRLMEPVYLVEIQCPADCVQAVYPVLARRRGHVVQDNPKPGAPFYTVKAYIPVIDSFGFETDLRCYTQGQAFCQQVFDHWSVVTGDPLDKSILLHPLEPSPPLALARDFMIKTRRRKGLTEDVNVGKYFDDATLLMLAKEQGALQ